MTTILVVDDEEQGRDWISRYLRHAGYDVASAATGEEALEILESRPVALVLLDLVMHPVSGVEVLRRIRRVRTMSELPVLMHSGVRNSPSIVEALDLGANDFINKPAELPVLLAKIRQHIGMRAAPVIPLGNTQGTVFDIGSMIGPYKLLSLLGEGMAARVYRARDTRLLRDVALKMLLQVNRERFLVEARALARVMHPHVVTVHDLGTEPCNFLAMELVEGTTLDRHLGAPLALPLALRWTGEILQALQAIHAQQVVHRDLKPENILISKSGQVKVTDFSVARMLEVEEEFKPGQLIGTPAYMAPEQISRSFGVVDERTDLFAVAAILYEMLTGSSPFPAQLQAQQLFAITTKEPDPLPDFVPPAVASICLRGLAKQPSDRFANADEFLGALKLETNL